jgi:hypothetical protein
MGKLGHGRYEHTGLRTILQASTHKRREDSYHNAIAYHIQTSANENWADAAQERSI